MGMKGKWKDTYIEAVVISIKIMFGPRLIPYNTGVYCEDFGKNTYAITASHCSKCSKVQNIVV